MANNHNSVELLGYISDIKQRPENELVMGFINVVTSSKRDNGKNNTGISINTLLFACHNNPAIYKATKDWKPYDYVRISGKLCVMNDRAGGQCPYCGERKANYKNVRRPYVYPLFAQKISSITDECFPYHVDVNSLVQIYYR